MQTTTEVFPNSYTIPVTWDTMDSAGRKSIFPGDKIVVDPKRKPKKGDVVLVKNTSEITIMEYQHPYLLTRSTKDYKSIDIILVDILGVVVQVIKTMI